MVIMVGGLGTRLGKLTESTPKSMVRIWGKPFLQHQIELLESKGIRKILLCVGHLGHKIKNYFGSGETFWVDIQYSDEGEELMGTDGET